MNANPMQQAMFHGTCRTVLSQWPNTALAHYARAGLAVNSTAAISQQAQMMLYNMSWWHGATADRVRVVLGACMNAHK